MLNLYNNIAKGLMARFEKDNASESAIELALEAYPDEVQAIVWREIARRCEDCTLWFLQY